MVEGNMNSTGTTVNEAGINTIIIGASAAGLACAASLKKRNVPFLILEKNEQLAGPWRAHYDRLHLNTEKWRSHLPYFPFPDHAATYVPRDELVAYLENYAARFNIKPLYNQEVLSVRQEKGRWKVLTPKDEWLCDHVIIATGYNRHPVIPSWPGKELYTGKLIHSSEYKNGAVYKGQNVLVVGFGSSACEIAICLHEYGAFPSMTVKAGINVVPRGAGNQAISHIFHQLSFFSRTFPSLVDSAIARALKRRYGFLINHGLSMLPYGPNVQMIKYMQVPVVDIGTMDLIKQGIIKIFPGIERFYEKNIRFTNGEEKLFDAVILATGFKPDVNDFIVDADLVTDGKGRPKNSGVESVLPGLFFCGFKISPYGMLHQIGKEARRIADKIKHRKVYKLKSPSMQ